MANLVISVESAPIIKGQWYGETGGLVYVPTHELSVVSSVIGPRGPRGDQGPPGPQGANITDAGVVNGDLVFTLSDSTTVNVGDVVSILGIKPLAVSASLNDVETGTLSTGLIAGGTF